MLQFFINYNIGSVAAPRRMQAGPFATVDLADRHRRTLAARNDLSLCWIGVSRDETRQLANDDATNVTPFIAPAMVPTAA
jgi:hypothetical protein